MGVFCRLQWALNSGSTGLIYASLERLQTVCYKIFSCFESFTRNFNVQFLEDLFYVGNVKCFLEY